jgi:hydroxyacylglutathione hydrolase
MKLYNDVYAYIWKGDDNNCNTYIFANVLANNKHIIIDPGHIITPYLNEPAYETLLQQISKDGLNIGDIKLVILSHAHPDHYEAAFKIKEKSNALIALHKDDEETLIGSGGTKIDFFLNEGELKLDPPVQDKIDIIKTPGHSPGEICIYWPSHKTLAVGDVVFYHNTGRYDLPGGDPFMLKESIEKLAALDVEYLLCGHPYGHPGVIQGKEAVKKNFSFILNYMFE